MRHATEHPRPAHPAMRWCVVSLAISGATAAACLLGHFSLLLGAVLILLGSISARNACADAPAGPTRNDGAMLIIISLIVFFAGGLASDRSNEWGFSLPKLAGLGILGTLIFIVLPVLIIREPVLMARPRSRPKRALHSFLFSILAVPLLCTLVMNPAEGFEKITPLAVPAVLMLRCAYLSLPQKARPEAGE